MQRWINIPKNRDTMLHVVSRGMNQILLSNLDISFTKECVTDSKCRPTCQVAQINRFGQGIWSILDESATGPIVDRIQNACESISFHNKTYLRVIYERSNGLIERSLLGYDTGLSIVSFTRFFSTLDSINQSGKGVNPPFRWILEIKIDGEQRAYFL